MDLQIVLNNFLTRMRTQDRLREKGTLTIAARLEAETLIEAIEEAEGAELEQAAKVFVDHVRNRPGAWEVLRPAFLELPYWYVAAAFGIGPCAEEYQRENEKLVQLRADAAKGAAGTGGASV